MRAPHDVLNEGLKERGASELLGELTYRFDGLVQKLEAQASLVRTAAASAAEASEHLARRVASAGQTTAAAVEEVTGIRERARKPLENLEDLEAKKKNLEETLATLSQAARVSR